MPIATTPSIRRTIAAATASLPTAARDGDCACGPTCTCVDCGCGCGD